MVWSAGARQQRRVLLEAERPFLIRQLVREFLAAGAEPAPGWRIRWIRKVSLQDDAAPLTFLPGIGQRNG
jgi:hypothetical protein